MDLVSAIGLISSFVTLEEAGRSWILIIKDKIKRKEIDINNWDSDDPLVQVCLDRFKTDMGDKYKDHIFSEEEIQDIIRGFFEQNRELRIGNEEKKQMTQIIEDILYAYNEYTKGKRDDIEKKIRILETYVNSIPEDYVRNILEKRLFLCKGRFSRWDVNKVKAEYSYKDKCFLNVQIEKYGSNHLNDVLYTVYLLNISELLPEILISISSCFTKAIRNSKEQFAKEIIDSQVIVDMIILKSFIFYSDEIKKDEKLINAYEDILLALTEIRNEKAAVLLDEFRIH